MSENLGELKENFDLMVIEDELTWDVENIHSANNRLQDWASRKGWVVRTKCLPPRSATYNRIPGRITVRRVA